MDTLPVELYASLLKHMDAASIIALYRASIRARTEITRWLNHHLNAFSIFDRVRLYESIPLSAKFCGIISKEKKVAAAMPILEEFLAFIDPGVPRVLSVRSGVSATYGGRPVSFTEIEDYGIVCFYTPHERSDVNVRFRIKSENMIEISVLTSYGHGHGIITNVRMTKIQIFSIVGDEYTIEINNFSLVCRTVHRMTSKGFVPPLDL